MVRWRDEIGERRLKADRGIPLAQASLGVLVFFLISLLLNGESLHRNAEEMPYGAPREISLRLTAPLRWISRATGSARIREWIEQFRNKEISHD